jgi:hypothetical protein
MHSPPQSALVETAGVGSRKQLKTFVLSGISPLVIQKSNPVHYNKGAEFPG